MLSKNLKDYAVAYVSGVLSQQALLSSSDIPQAFLWKSRLKNAPFHSASITSFYGAILNKTINVQINSQILHSFTVFLRIPGFKDTNIYKMQRSLTFHPLSI